MSTQTSLSKEFLSAARAKKQGSRHVSTIAFALVMLLGVCLLCSGCGASSQSKTSSSKGDSYKQETFHDISFSVPKEFTSVDNPESDFMAYDLGEKSKDPFAACLYIQVFPDSAITAQDIYNAESEFGDCELVSANGIEICWEPDVYSGSNMVDSELAFSYNGSLYMAHVSYKPDYRPSYKEFAENFYKSIRPAGTDTGASTTSKGSKQPKSSGSKSNIPSDAIEWTNASKYLGKTVTVYGPIVNSTSASSSNGLPTYLDMGAAYPASSRVSIVIWEEDAHNFPQSPTSMYEGKTICVTGEVYSYSGACNIKVTSPSQVKVIG